MLIDPDTPMAVFNEVVPCLASLPWLCPVGLVGRHLAVVRSNLDRSPQKLTNQIGVCSSAWVLVVRCMPYRHMHREHHQTPNLCTTMHQ